jgi:transposase
MKATDTRSLSKESRTELRLRAVSAYLSTPGRNIEKIAKLFSVRRQTLRGWVTLHENKGKSALSYDKRGAKKWQNTKLAARQANAVKNLIIKKNPDQVELPFMLWTREAVQELISRKYKIKLGLSTVSSYLRSWGMSPQKPKLKSYKQQPVEIQRWLDKTYPEIAARAKREGAEIHWGDETAIRSEDQVGRGFSLIGETPVLRTSGSRFGVNMVSSVSNRGTMRFMLFDGSMNAIRFKDFLRRLIKGQDKKTFLILDNCRVHHAKLIQEWTKKHHDRIELFFLPPYAPEHNPDELLNNTLKSKLKNTTRAQDATTLANTVSTILKSLQNTPELIRSFFQTETTKYASSAFAA